MRVLSFLYKNKTSFLALLRKEDYSFDLPYVVEIYTTNLIRKKAEILKNDVLSVLPNATIVGVSVGGVVYNGQNYDDQTLMVIKDIEHTKYKVSSCVLTDDVSYLAKEVYESALQKSSMMNIFFPDSYLRTNEFVEEFNRLNTNIKLYGGIAGKIGDNSIESFVFSNEGILKNKVLFISYAGKMKVTSNSHISARAITDIHTLTKKSEVYWNEIDDIPIEKWMDKNLGITKFKEFKKISTAVSRDKLLRIQTILEKDKQIIRFFRYNKKNKKIDQYYADVPEGTKFRIGYTSIEECVQELHDTCDLISNSSSEFMFFYSCVFRKYYFKNLYQLEISPFLNENIVGIFLFGEIVYVGHKNQLLNGSCTIASFAEKKRKITPDYSVFDYLNTLKDNVEFLNFMKLKHITKTEQENKFLLQKLDYLIKKDNTMDDKLYQYPYYKMFNYLKFQVDDKQKKYTKICLVKIDNYDVIQQHLGRDNYFKLLHRLGSMIEKKIANTKILDYIHFYGMQEDKFILAADQSVADDVFMNYVMDFFYEYNSMEVDDVYIILRFIIAIDIKRPLEIALSTLRERNDLQYNFIICNEENKFIDHVTEMKIIKIIKKAIKNRNIIPYYQPIFDNETESIIKYESLMRLKVEDVLYTPSEFMAVAKKYHLYSYLSEIMIEKVMNDFNKREDMVNINISIYDIKSTRFISRFKKLLEEYKDINLCIEITEEENYNNIEEINSFLELLKEKNVKIAIDDFGSGYSNFINILNLSPDYIKIDGSIIKTIENEKNQLIIETIKFLADRLKLDLIAEFVENKEIFDKVKAMNIKYSQGFYISKPKPLEQL